MKLQVPFLQLPLQFDAERMADEMDALGPKAWRDHPSKYPGNFALPLIAVDGDPASDAVAGPMRPTPWLERCPYLAAVLDRLGAVWGRTRLMKLAGGAEVTPHVDINYYWREHLRVHVPITTQPGVRFQCGDAEVNMAPGECWIFDTWRPHRVINVPGFERVHLVADTVGGERFWNIANRGRAPGQPADPAWQPEQLRGDGPADVLGRLELERVNAPVVMSPWELREHLLFLVASANPDPRLAVLQQAIQRFVADWRALWALHGDSGQGLDAYADALGGFEEAARLIVGPVQLGNGMPLFDTMRSMILKTALAARQSSFADDGADASSVVASAPRKSVVHGHIERPVFVVSPPRSGSTLLFETLALSPDLATIGGESHRLIEVEVAGGALGAQARGHESNRLLPDDATPDVVREVRERFRAQVRDRDGRPPDGPVRLLEKTPKNALRVGFLDRIFPDATFVYLYRDPREVLASMLEAWESGRFRTYPELPGWSGPPWSLVLTPGWRELVGRPLPEIVAAQWRVTTGILLDDLERLPPGRCIGLRYEALVNDPDAELRRLCDALGVAWNRKLDGELPPARYTVSAPREGKWRAREREIAPLLPELETMRTRAIRMLDAIGPGQRNPA